MLSILGQSRYYAKILVLQLEKACIVLLRSLCDNNFADVTIWGWKGSVPTPDQSFEIREQWLDGEDWALFVQFLRRMLCWVPEERPVAEELAFDEFLMQP